MAEVTTELRSPDHVDRKDRSIKNRWTLKEIPDGTVEAVLIVSHDKDRRIYYATLYRQERVRESGFVVEKFEPMDHGIGFIRLMQQPCPRYSAKGLEQFNDQAVAMVRGAVDDLRVASRFTVA